MKSFLMIGLGEFGKSVAKTLCSNNATVLVTDAKENLIKQALNEGIIEEAIVLDATDEIALKKVVHDDFDTALVSIGDNMQANIPITLQLGELGTKNVVYKTVDHTQEKVFYRMGATQVVFPKESMGEKVAYSVLKPATVDYSKFAEDYFICEVRIPKTYVRKSLMELNLRYKHEVNILAIRHFDGKMDVIPNPNIKLSKDDLLITLSRENVIDRVTKT